MPMLPLTTVKIPELVVPAEPPKVPKGAAERSGTAAEFHRPEAADREAPHEVREHGVARDCHVRNPVGTAFESLPYRSRRP